jgi:SNF2 family DNA or RNA helicase
MESERRSSCCTTYEVLYFKRKNKVHKSKGVSKMDGRMVLDSKTCVVKLYEESGSRPIHSSTNSEIAKRSFSVDEEVNLAQYQVGIVSIVSTASATKGNPNSKPAPARMSAGDNQAKLVRKPLSLANRKPITNRPKSLFKKSGSAVRSNSWQNRRPPAQPKGSQAADDSSSDDDEEERTESTTRPAAAAAAPTRKSPFLGLAGRKRKIVATRKPTLQSISQASSHQANALPGAIGTLVLAPSIRSVLRPHQETGVAYLWNCLTGASPHLQRIARQAGVDPTPRGAVLADSMGMGKTLMTIATVFGLYRRSKQLRSIIVCPSSLVQNWAKEFDKWLGRASQPKRVVVKKGGQEGLQIIRGFCPVKPNHSEILIISYDLFRMNSSLLKEAKQIGLLVVDEGHRLKNSSGSVTLSALNALDCESRLLITGTPIQNNLSEFHAVASFVCPGILGTLADFRRDFERPMTAANRKDASRQHRQAGKEQSEALDDVIKAFMLRRLAKDVLAGILPPRTEMLLFCQPSALQCKLYKETTQAKISDPLSTLTKLRKLCSHPVLMTAKDGGKKKMSGNDVEASGKLHLLQMLLDSIRENSPEDKVVLVSCYTSILSLIEEMVIKPKGWTYKRLDGSTTQSDRQPLVDSFNRSTAEQSFCFLLSSKAGGMGLNLIGANRLIMFDADYNPAIDAQAMARIYRPGQTKPTSIYRLFTAGTMEEVVYQRQQHKGNLANMTVDGTTTAESGKFTNEELRDCFTLKENTRCETKKKMKWPDYKGSDCLVSHGCTDGPILQVARSNKPFFVRIVPVEEPSNESETSKISIDSDIDILEEEKAASVALSSDEEFEFDDQVLEQGQ